MSHLTIIGELEFNWIRDARLQIFDLNNGGKWGWFYSMTSKWFTGITAKIILNNISRSGEGEITS